MYGCIYVQVCRDKGNLQWHHIFAGNQPPNPGTFSFCVVCSSNQQFFAVCDKLLLYLHYGKSYGFIDAPCPFQQSNQRAQKTKRNGIGYIHSIQGLGFIPPWQRDRCAVSYKTKDIYDMIFDNGDLEHKF
jgi:hypothetical protein